MTSVEAEAEAGPSNLNPKISTIPVRLVSRTDAYAVPSSKFMIPSDWRRFQLSELINKVCGNEQAIPFDFIVNEELLRTSLGEWTKAKGLTEESILEIEYVESILPPKYLDSFQAEDWVSDVDLQERGLFLTSSYDNNLRIFSSSGGPTQIISGHTLPVLSTCWLPSNSSEPISSRYLASGGMDRVIQVWRMGGEGEAIQATHTLALHTAPVASLRSTLSPNPLKRQFLSAGWDGLIGYWDFDLVHGNSATNHEKSDHNVDDGPRSKKRHKIGGNSSTTGEKATQIHPTLILYGHIGHVSRAIFDNSSSGRTAYSSGLDDHSVRQWDLDAAGQQTAMKQSDKAILDADQMATPNLLVTGNADKTVCLWDMREETSIISMTLTGHTSSVSAVSAHDTSPLLLCSASYDSTVRIWDARSPKQALFTVARQQSGKGNKSNKIVCAEWDGEIVASGGEDGNLELIQSKGM